MTKDLTIQTEDGIVNIRVGAIILRDGKFLMAGNKNSSRLWSVGGRIRFGESAREAVEREVWEETGVRMQADRLGFIHENFFKINTQPVYEIEYLFYMQVPPDFEPAMRPTEAGTEAGGRENDGQEEFLAWVSPDDDRLFYPEFFRTELLHPVREVKHMVTRS